MSAKLSRYIAKLMNKQPLVYLTAEQRFELASAVQKADSIDRLPEKWSKLVKLAQQAQ